MSALVERLARSLYADAGEAEAFVAAVGNGGSAVPAAVFPADHEPQRGTLPDWVPSWVGLPDSSCAAAYGLDLSSVWAAMVLTAAGPVRALLDLCASPGGKSVFAARALRPATQVANEVVGKRLGPLRHNLARCGVVAFTQRQDVGWWAERAAAAFDLVLVDAPCSGQSLVARGVENRGCFHPAVVDGNARRQRGILLRAAECVAPGGWLAYLTCTYSLAENERTVGWFLKKHAGWSAVEVPGLVPWRSPHSEVPCHRLGPHERLGAGGFSCLLRRDGVAGDLPAVPAEALAWPVAGHRQGPFSERSGGVESDPS